MSASTKAPSSCLDWGRHYKSPQRYPKDLTRVCYDRLSCGMILPQFVAASIAFSLPLVASVVVCNEAHLMVCALASAFVWLLSMILAAIALFMLPANLESSVVWIAVVVTACFQEAGRFAFVLLHRWVVPKLNDGNFDEKSSSLAAGVGFATIHVLVVFGTFLGTEPYCLFTGAFIAMLFTILDVIWMRLAFADNHSVWVAIVASHLAASGATCISSTCGASVPMVIVVLFLTTLLLGCCSLDRQQCCISMSLRPLPYPYAPTGQLSAAPSTPTPDSSPSLISSRPHCTSSSRPS